MKLNQSMLVVAMVVGALGATGCSKSSETIKDTGNNAAATEDTKAATPEDNPDAAPVSETSVASENPGTEKDARFYHYWAPRAPPALRIEERGVAPSPGHWWRPGYYGWTGTDYTWYGGRWYAPRAGYEYVYPRWHHIGNRWGYYPGRWHRR
jgi:hypothetical protein